MHLLHDVAPAHELAVDKDLRDGGPRGEILDARAQLLPNRVHTTAAAQSNLSPVTNQKNSQPFDNLLYDGVKLSLQREGGGGRRGGGGEGVGEERNKIEGSVPTLQVRTGGKKSPEVKP